jgi:Biotin-lipoyl like
MKTIRLCVALIIIVTVAACSGGQTGGPQASETQTAQEQAAQAEAVVWASGKLVPERWAGLSPAIAGAVRAVHVSEGDAVEAGQLLVELDNGVLRSQVETAAAALAEAEAARDHQLAGATSAQVAAAKADLAGAKAGVTQAQADLEQARQAAAAAQSQVAIAQAQYDELASGPTRAELLQAQREINLTQLAVNNAQAAYDLVKGNPDIAARPEALALQQATASLDAARGAYDVIAQGATRQQLAVLRSQVEAAKTQADVAAAAIPSTEARVQSAQAMVDRAQAALDGLTAGAATEERAMAEARVASAGPVGADPGVRTVRRAGRQRVRPARRNGHARTGAAYPRRHVADARGDHRLARDRRGPPEDRHGGGGHLRCAAWAGIPGHDPQDRPHEQRREGQHQLYGDRGRAGVGCQPALGNDGVCEHPSGGGLTIYD